MNEYDFLRVELCLMTRPWGPMSSGIVVLRRRTSHDLFWHQEPQRYGGSLLLVGIRLNTPNMPHCSPEDETDSLLAGRPWGVTGR